MGIEFLMVLCLLSLINGHSIKQEDFSKLRNDKSNIVKKERCGGTLGVYDCNYSIPLELSKRYRHEIRANYTVPPDCLIEDVLFDWDLYIGPEKKLESYEDYANGPVFILEPFKLDTGIHTFVVGMSELLYGESSYIRSFAMAICQIEIFPEIPIPIITGGSKVTAVDGEDLEVLGSESIDMDVPYGEKGNLEYRWSCSATGVISEFCKGNLGSEPYIIIPAKEAINNAVFTVTLSVRTKDVDWQSTQQIINFLHPRIRSGIKIVCLKNCPPHAYKTNSKKSTALEAVCVKNCKGYSSNQKFRWWIDIPNFDYDLETKTGRHTNHFHIKEDVLEEGNMYFISVKMIDPPGSAYIEIKVHVGPKLSACKITPTHGVSLTTDFLANCRYSEGEYTFEIYGITDGIDFLVATGEKLEEIHFTLTTGSKAKVKIIDEYNFSDSMEIDVTVTSFLKTTGSNEDIGNNILENYIDDEAKFSISKMMKEKDYDGALKAANSLIDDLKVLKSEGKGEIAEKYYIEVLIELSSIPTTTEVQAKQLSALATKVTEEYKSKPVPDISYLGTSLCERSAHKILEEVETKDFPGSYLDDAIDAVGVLGKCSEAISGENEEVLTSDVEVPEITTPFPLLNISVIDEDYPDYVDDQETSDAMDKFDKSAESIMGLCYISSRQLATVMSVKDDTIVVEGDGFTVTSTLRLGSDVLGTKIESKNITLFPSLDFTTKTLPVHITFCASTQDLYWWGQDRKVFSAVAIVQFAVKKKVIRKFEKPFMLTFSPHKDIKSSLIIHTSSTPRVPNENLSRVEQDFERISLHRIEGLRRQSFAVEFIDLPGNVTLNVVVADYFKPSFKEFRLMAEQVTKTKNILFIANDKSYVSWYYLMVLPPVSLLNRTTDYKFSVYSMACYRWRKKRATWTFGCSSTDQSSYSKIFCECYGSSAFTAMITNNDVREEETLIEELVLETQASYIILASVCFAFFMYCVFLTLFSIVGLNTMTEEPIYLLGDVPKQYRYAYLVIVRTGNKSKAGTTSHVLIKIYGNKSESKVHILNYPDPEHKLLQKNEENWFLLATEHYLGDIEKVDVWCKSVGFCPAWFCSEIEVFDMQEHKYWLFRINKWFEILRNEELAYTAHQTNPDAREKKKKVAKACRLFRKFKDSFRGAHMWNLLSREEENIMILNRLHVAYSIFLTTYATALWLFGCPRMENSDSLAYTLDYEIDKYVIIYTFACFILTFVVHFPIVWFFRYPKEHVFGKWEKGTLKGYILNSNFLCWFFLITNIVVMMTLLILLGFWVPHITGMLWLTTIGISILVYIFLMENVMRLIVAFTTNPLTRVQSVFNKLRSVLTTLEKQRAILYSTFGNVLLRSQLRQFYIPLQKVTLKELKYLAQIKNRLWEIFEDLIMITMYVLMLYLVIVMEKDRMTYRSHLEVRELVEGTHSRTVMLEDVYYRKEMIDYVNHTLIAAMQSLQWYGKYVHKNPGITVDNANKYLGVVRLRQHRARNISCYIDFLINVSSCHPTYNWHPDFGSYSQRWGPDKWSNRFNRMDKVWDYTTQNEAGTMDYLGDFSVYPGGGYITNLGRRMENSLLNYDYIIRNHWVDSSSRCILAEFILYNPNTNLFSAVTVIFEFYPTGYLTQKLKVNTSRLLFIKETRGIAFWIIISCFILTLVVLVMKIGFRLVQKKKLVLKDIWNIVDILIILMSLTCVTLYVIRSNAVGVFLSKVEKARHNEFINYFHLLHTDGSLTMMAAILVFLATFRLWKLMRFMTIIKVVEKTLLYSAPHVLGLFMYQILFMVTSTFYVNLMYGTSGGNFHGFYNTITILFLESLSLNQSFEFEPLYHTMGYIFYSMYMIVMLGIYTIYIAIITISYTAAQNYYSHEEEYTIVDLLKEQFQYYKDAIRLRWKKFRLRGGADIFDRMVQPKADEFRYENCITVPTNRMNGMGFVSKCVLRNMRRQNRGKISHEDSELIKNTLVNLYMNDTEKKEIFFICNVEGQEVKLVDDRIVKKIARVTEALLSTHKRKLEKKKHKEIVKNIMKSHAEKMKEMNENLEQLTRILKDINT